MEQHAVPQQISSYQFRLVGDMTLKQFFYVAGGALVSLLVYATPLPPLIKWPIIFISFGFGAALAFLPFEERPLSKWITAFFRSVYSPTLYFWKNEPLPAFYQEEASTPSEKVIAKGGEIGLKEYLSEITPQKLPALSKLEETENTFLSELGILFRSGSDTSGTAPIPPFIPAVDVQVTPGKATQWLDELPGATPKPAQTSQMPKPMSGYSSQLRPSLVIPSKLRVKYVTDETPPEIPHEEKEEKVSLSEVSEVIGSKGEIASQLAEFSIEAAPPNPPTIPNTVVGQVFDNNGKIVEGAILEIRDIAGRPVRALRSNKLGHFIIVTSLLDGQYTIITEKDNYYFSPVTFETTGKIIPPIAIRGKIEPKIVVAEENPNTENPALNSSKAIF